MTDRHVVVVGLGNTGSQLAPLLARMGDVSRITLVDPGAYEAANVAVQNIEASDIGKPKVEAQAEKLRRIRQDLEVVALEQRIEDVPRGQLVCDLFASCLDSKGSRQSLNEIAWRLNTPWSDCGVLGSLNLVRVNSYVPSDESACLECAWGHDEYSVLEQEYVCGGGVASYPTLATSALGALAGALMAVEIGKLLRGDVDCSLASRQLVMDAQHQKLQVTQMRKNVWCRFDHRTWQIEPWVCPPETTTLGAALNTLGTLQVEGHRFASDLICPGCMKREQALRLNRPLARCNACNRRMITAGFGSLDRLDRELAGEYVSRTLAQVGLRAGDIVSGGNRHRRLLEAA